MIYKFLYNIKIIFYFPLRNTLCRIKRIGGSIKLIIGRLVKEYVKNCGSIPDFKGHRMSIFFNLYII